MIRGGFCDEKYLNIKTHNNSHCLLKLEMCMIYGLSNWFTRRISWLSYQTTLQPIQFHHSQTKLTSFQEENGGRWCFNHLFPLLQSRPLLRLEIADFELGRWCHLAPQVSPPENPNENLAETATQSVQSRSFQSATWKETPVKSRSVKFGFKPFRPLSSRIPTKFRWLIWHCHIFSRKFEYRKASISSKPPMEPEATHSCHSSYKSNIARLSRHPNHPNPPSTKPAIWSCVMYELSPLRQSQYSHRSSWPSRYRSGNPHIALLCSMDYVTRGSSRSTSHGALVGL